MSSERASPTRRLRLNAPINSAADIAALVPDRPLPEWIQHHHKHSSTSKNKRRDGSSSADYLVRGE